MKIMTSLKALAGTIRTNFVEGYTYLCISVGLPAVAYVFADWRYALAVFVATQIAIGVLALRNSN